MSRDAPPRETVVLLHGIGRSPSSLVPVESRLQRAGYATLNLAYPWRDKAIPELAAFVADALRAKGLCDAGNRLHFVTHSMGGLVAACMLSTFPAEVIGRVVMLGPPIGGSEVADALVSFAPYRWLYGPAGQDLTTRSGILAGIVPDYPFGIIAGTLGWPYLTGLLIPGAHDGRVPVERTRWAGMSDHLTLPVMHSLMPNDRTVQNQIVHFLDTGMFRRAASAPPS